MMNKNAVMFRVGQCNIISRLKWGLIFGLVGLLLIIPPVSLSAQASVTIGLMEQANQLYEAGQFAEAAEVYQSLVDAGFEDGILFYNLGNAHFKQENWGLAILNYRRAQRLMPRDPDIRANLILVRAQTVDQIEARGGEILLDQIIRFPGQWLTLDETAIVTLGLWFGLILGIIIFARLESETWKQRLSYLLVILAILLAGGLLSLGGRLYVEHVRPEGVIVAEEIEITSGPGFQYVVEFTLHEGTEVSILEERPNWIRLMLPGGQLQGWVPAWAVETVSG